MHTYSFVNLNICDNDTLSSWEYFPWTPSTVWMNEGICHFGGQLYVTGPTE